MDKIISYKIKLVAKEYSETVIANRYQLEGSPQEFVFYQDNREVRRVLVSAMEKNPEPQYPVTDADKKAWKKFRDRNPTRKQRRLRPE